MTVSARAVYDRFRVTERCSVEIVVTTDADLRAGDVVEWQFPTSWTIGVGPGDKRPLQHTDPSGAHHVCVHVPGCDVAFAMGISPRQLNSPQDGNWHARHIQATLERGHIPAGTEMVIRYANTWAPFVAETDTVWLRVKGQAPEAEPALTVIGDEHASFRVLAPSGVEPGQTFDVLVVSLDCFENPSCTPFANEALRRLDGCVVAKGIDFTGSVRIPATLESEGVFRFRFREAVSNAVQVARGRHGPYWGDIHIHTRLSMDAQGTDPYDYARDVSGLDFAGVADHWECLSEEGYRILEAWAEEANRPGRFVTILGDERVPPALTGDHNIYFRDLETFRQNQVFRGRGTKRSDEQEAADLRGLDPARAMLVPHHTGIEFSGGYDMGVRWDAWDDPGLRPIMEIYSHHGQSEIYNPHHVLAYEFNGIRKPQRASTRSVPGPFYAQDYWMAGKRIGVIASSDEHSGQGGRRHGGLAAVWAEELTRGGIFDSLRARRCYATTGERILVDFGVDGVPMGGSLERSPGSRVDLSLRVWGTDLLVRVDVLRFRFGVDSRFAPILSEAPRPETSDASYDLHDEVEGPCMYYARITQEPFAWPGMAWTSPIWVDVRRRVNRRPRGAGAAAI